MLPSIVESSGADIVSFGMGERQTAELARRLAAGEPVEEITGVVGTCYLTDFAGLPASYVAVSYTHLFFCASISAPNFSFAAVMFSNLRASVVVYFLPPRMPRKACLLYKSRCV